MFSIIIEDHRVLLERYRNADLQDLKCSNMSQVGNESTVTAFLFVRHTYFDIYYKNLVRDNVEKGNYLYDAEINGDAGVGELQTEIAQELFLPDTRFTQEEKLRALTI